MSQFSKDFQTDFQGHIFRELFQFKIRSLLLGHPLDKNNAINRISGQI